MTGVSTREEREVSEEEEGGWRQEGIEGPPLMMF